MAGGNIYNITSEKDFLNAVKKDGEEKGNIWNTETVLDAYNKIEMGMELKPSPFFMPRDNDWRKGNISFDYSNKELRELKKCMQDPIYFAENYAYLMTSEGYQKIDVRKYQKKMISDYNENNNVIVLSARQVGKCVDFHTEITIKEKDSVKTMKIGELFFRELKKKRKLTFLERIKYFIFKKL